MGENFRVRSLLKIISYYQNYPIALFSQGSRLPDAFLSQTLEKEEDDIIYSF